MPIIIGYLLYLFPGKPGVFGGTGHAEFGSFDIVSRHNMIASANAMDHSRDI